MIARGLRNLVDGVTVVDGEAGRVESGSGAAADHDLTLCVTDTKRIRRLPPGGMPVLSIGPRATRPFMPVSGGTVVVCLDGSKRAEAALPPAARWARALGADLLLVTVVATATTQRLAALAPRCDLREDAALASAARHVALEGLPLSWEVLHGTAATALLSLVHRGDVRLVVLNSHGHSTPAGESLARLPSQLVRRSPAPVLLTRCTVSPRRDAAVGCRDRPPAAPAALGRGQPARSRPGTYRAPPAAPAHVVRLRTCPPPPPTSRPKIDPRRAAILAVVAVSSLCALTTVDVPYQTTSGATIAASELVGTADGDPGGGAFLVTYVRSEGLDGWGLMQAWLDPEADVRPRVDAGDRLHHRELMTVAMETAQRLAGERTHPARASAVRVDTHEIGGPSAGLALTLQLIDDLTHGDLTGGHVVAVTGGVTAEGAVTPVGGIRFKTGAARAGGAELFLVPSANYAEAASAGPGLRIVPVSTLAEALEILHRLATTGAV